MTLDEQLKAALNDFWAASSSDEDRSTAVARFYDVLLRFADDAR